jgi:hypothetical protein
MSRSAAWRVVAVVCPVLVALAAEPAAFAQAGSTGGTVGKQDKSVSGGEENEGPSGGRRNQKPRKPSSEGPQASLEVGGCGSLAGSWTWKWLSESVHAVLRADGTATRSDSVSGNWSCSGSAVTVTWSAGDPDRLMLSPNGKRLSGTGTFGIAVTGIRN